MSLVVVCPLSEVAATVDRLGASHLVSLIDVETLVARPDSISPQNHLYLGIHDITEPMDGYVLPSEEHVARVLGFVRGWDRGAPWVIHCWAGVSRSTASAFATACALNPHRDEMEIARKLRAASPIASPNRLLVALADKALGREGRMVRALEEIGPASMMVEGKPFRLELD